MNQRKRGDVSEQRATCVEVFSITDCFKHHPAGPSTLSGPSLLSLKFLRLNSRHDGDVECRPWNSEISAQSAEQETKELIGKSYFHLRTVSKLRSFISKVEMIVLPPSRTARIYSHQ